jgi:hypothetical protein
MVGVDPERLFSWGLWTNPGPNDRLLVGSVDRESDSRIGVVKFQSALGDVAAYPLQPTAPRQYSVNASRNSCGNMDADEVSQVASRVSNVCHRPREKA